MFKIKDRKILSFLKDDIYVFYDGLFQFFTFTLFPDKLKSIFRVRLDQDIKDFAQEKKLNYYEFKFSSWADVQYWIRQNPDSPIFDIWRSFYVKEKN